MAPRTASTSAPAVRSPLCAPLLPAAICNAATRHGLAHVQRAALLPAGDARLCAPRHAPVHKASARNLSIPQLYR